MFITARRDARPRFSGRETLAAAKVRARCVLTDGCPVVSVHFSPGIARHIGHRTDNICRRVSLSVSTFSTIHHRQVDRWSIVLFMFVLMLYRTESGIDGAAGISRFDRVSSVDATPMPTFSSSKLERSHANPSPLGCRKRRVLWFRRCSDLEMARLPGRTVEATRMRRHACSELSIAILS